MTHARARKPIERLDRNTARAERAVALQRCARSGKLTFRSQAEARRETIAIKARGRFVGPLMAVYQCRWCGEWHMTSTTREGSAQTT